MSRKIGIVVFSFAVLLFIVGCGNNSVSKGSGNNDVEMFAGFRDDFGGNECGGMCWDFYTFLPDDKIVVGLPVNGGPETIDCKHDECLEYTISGGQIELSNGKSYTYESNDGELVINDVRLSKVEPVPNDTTFDNVYTYIGYSGLVGVSSGSSSWTYKLDLNPDGTFELDGVTIGSVGGSSGVTTDGSSAGTSSKGTYEIKKNTMTMKTDDNVEQVLFFIHDSDVKDIQVGNKNYYVKED